MPAADPVLSLPKRQTALTTQGPGKLAVQHDAPVVGLQPGMAMVRIAAVALGPADAAMIDRCGTAGRIAGFDFAGTVVALGDAAPAVADGLQVGDRVAGMVSGLNNGQPDVGAFAQYVGAPADLLLRIPDHMTFEDAATLGVGVSAAVLALFAELRVPVTPEQLGASTGYGLGDEDAPFVLVAGGSTATGTRAIQLLKLAGLRPIATCSPTNFELAEYFGAEAVFDYRSPNAAADIRALTGNDLGYALDCVSHPKTMALCYDAIGRAGGRYCSLKPFDKNIARRRALTVEPSWLLAPSIFGRKVVVNGKHCRPAQPELRRLGSRAYRAVQALLDRDLIDTHPAKVMPGGWEGVRQGVRLIREHTCSGYKMVYRLD